jgi:hypothetical protein
MVAEPIAAVKENALRSRGGSLDKSAVGEPLRELAD